MVRKKCDPCKLSNSIIYCGEDLENIGVQNGDDYQDVLNSINSAVTGGGGNTVQTVTGNAVDNTDPLNPIINFPTSFGQNIGNSDLPIDEPTRVLTMLNEGEFLIQNDYSKQRFYGFSDVDHRVDSYEVGVYNETADFGAGLLLSKEDYISPIYHASLAQLQAYNLSYLNENTRGYFQASAGDIQSTTEQIAESLVTDINGDYIGKKISSYFGDGGAQVSSVYEDVFDSSLNRTGAMLLRPDYFGLFLSDENDTYSGMFIDTDGNLNIEPYEKVILNRIIEANYPDSLSGRVGFEWSESGRILFNGITDDFSPVMWSALDDFSEYGRIDINGNYPRFSQQSSTGYSELEVQENCLFIEGSSTTFSGINASDYWGANYVPTSFVQKQYVDTELVSTDYGEVVNVTGRNVQVFTTTSGVGIISVNLLPSVPVGALLFVSDLGNDAINNNIIINSGIGSGILKGDGSPMAQTMTIDSSGFSFTLRKLTPTQWMVIGTNQ